MVEETLVQCRPETLSPIVSGETFFGPVRQDERGKQNSPTFFPPILSENVALSRRPTKYDNLHCEISKREGKKAFFPCLPDKFVQSFRTL